MIGLKKKKVEQDKAAAAAKIEEAADAAADAAAPVVDLTAPKPDATGKPAGRGRGRGAGRGRGVSIFGVSGASKAKKGARKLRPGEIRVQKDVSELDGGDCARPVFPDPNDLMNFKVVVTPDDGFWKGCQYTFDFEVPDMYPHDPPKVKCNNKIYHPNIDLEGNVCLNILRADWKPVLDINAVIYGLIVLFVQPNPEDPLNHKAAETMRDDARQFAANVQKSLRGGSVDGESYPPAIRPK